MRILLLLTFGACCFAQSEQPAVRLVTSDIDNFWKAYDASQPGHREQTFQRLYLDVGSPGLKDFVASRIQSAKALATAVDQRYPKFFASVRPQTILKYLDRYKELYPAAHFPPVYFVIGRLTSGGTTGSSGLLIGTEVNSAGPDVDTSEINPSFRRAMHSIDLVPLIVVHELTHVQVGWPGRQVLPGLLARSLGEGSADFMTELVANSSINSYAREWADPRRDELFERFAQDMANKPNDAGKWLYNDDSVKDEPADLGYWIGAEICRDYYAQAKDKAAAVREIVTQQHPEIIVKNSRYASLLKPAPKPAN